MALIYVGPESFPNYIALSTDISGSKIAGASNIGQTVYTTDDKKWYIISGSSLILTSFVTPASET